MCCVVVRRLLMSALAPGIEPGSELTISYTNNQLSSIRMLASWGFTPQLQLVPHEVGGRPDLVLPAQGWALPGLKWQLLAWAACRLHVEGFLRFSDPDQAEVRDVAPAWTCMYVCAEGAMYVTGVFAYLDEEQPKGVGGRLLVHAISDGSDGWRLIKLILLSFFEPQHQMLLLH
jgi:hypothetical protein